VSPSDLTKSRRVLIASSHSLFGQGLRSLLRERKEAGVEIVGMVSNLDEALLALDQLNPDLIIVDYDDKKLNRDEFWRGLSKAESCAPFCFVTERPGRIIYTLHHGRP
jgi:DNA-binding NarL/FixJ family response regulator